MKKTKVLKKIILFSLCFATVLLSSVAVSCKIQHCKPHDWGEWVVSADKTCSTDGGRHRECKVCGEIVSETLKAGHEYGEWIQEVLPTCETDGVVGHYHCIDCGKNFDDQKQEISEIVIEGGHQFTTVAGYDKTCTSDGLVEHKHCAKCDKNYDSQGNELEQVIINAQHEWEFFEKVENTCLVPGMQAHYYCLECGEYCDEEKKPTTKSQLKIAKGHDLVSVKAKDKTCSTNGNIAYEQCSRCEKKFNSYGIEIFNEVIKAGHEYGELVNKKDKTCTTDGMHAHYYCEECEGYFDANKNASNKAMLTIPASHETEVVEEKNKTCTTDGNIEHEKCKICGTCVDGDGNELSSVIIPASHNLIPVDFQEATCVQDGVVEHFYCEDCSLNFDGEGNELSIVTIPANHKYSETAVERVEPSCEENGKKEHYTCSGCSGLFVKDGDEFVEVDEEYLLIEGGHEYYIKEEKQSTCVEEGYSQHYACENCEKVFVFDEETQTYIQTSLSELALPLKDHQYTFVAEESATETESGLREHYICAEDGCEKLFIKEGEEFVEVQMQDLIIDPITPSEPTDPDEPEDEPIIPEGTVDPENPDNDNE